MKTSIQHSSPSRYQTMTPNVNKVIAILFSCCLFPASVMAGNERMNVPFIAADDLRNDSGAAARRRNARVLTADTKTKTVV